MKLYFIHPEWIFVTNSIKNNFLQKLTFLLFIMQLCDLINLNIETRINPMTCTFFHKKIYDCMINTMYVPFSELQFFFFLRLHISQRKDTSKWHFSSEWKVNNNSPLFKIITFTKNTDIQFSIQNYQNGLFWHHYQSCINWMIVWDCTVSITSYTISHKMFIDVTFSCWSTSKSTLSMKMTLRSILFLLIKWQQRRVLNGLPWLLLLFSVFLLFVLLLCFIFLLLLFLCWGIQFCFFPASLHRFLKRDLPIWCRLWKNQSRDYR